MTSSRASHNARRATSACQRAHVSTGGVHEKEEEEGSREGGSVWEESKGKSPWYPHNSSCLYTDSKIDYANSATVINVSQEIREIGGSERDMNQRLPPPPRKRPGKDA